MPDVAKFEWSLPSSSFRGACSLTLNTFCDKSRGITLRWLTKKLRESTQCGGPWRPNPEINKNLPNMHVWVLSPPSWMCGVILGCQRINREGSIWIVRPPWVICSRELIIKGAEGKVLEQYKYVLKSSWTLPLFQHCSVPLVPLRGNHLCDVVFQTAGMVDLKVPREYIFKHYVHKCACSFRM